MSVLVAGQVARIDEREAGNPGNTWIERTLVIEDWGRTHFVVAGRELTEAGLPAVGERVVLEASVRPYVSRKNPGEAGYGLTGHKRNGEAEKALFGAAVRAAS